MSVPNKAFLNSSQQPDMVAPLVSMVMVTYKEVPARLKRSIECILAQTVSDLELIIVFEKGDGNIDFVQQTFADRRIICIVNGGERHRNVCHNLGLSHARGKYLGRIDGDDYTYPDRLEKQINFLRNYPDVAMIGASARLIDAEGSVVGERVCPSTHAEIVSAMMFCNPILHSTVLWDRDRVGRDTRYALQRVDDFELWLRFISQGHKIASLPEILLDYTQPAAYSRPTGDWRNNFNVRLIHWRAGFRHPVLFLGILGYGVLSILPSPVIQLLTRKSWLSDRLRRIKRS